MNELSMDCHFEDLEVVPLFKNDVIGSPFSAALPFNEHDPTTVEVSIIVTRWI
jgi:hypothetical protein